MISITIWDASAHNQMIGMVEQEELPTIGQDIRHGKVVWKVVDFVFADLGKFHCICIPAYGAETVRSAATKRALWFVGILILLVC